MSKIKDIVTGGSLLRRSAVMSFGLGAATALFLFVASSAITAFAVDGDDDVDETSEVEDPRVAVSKLDKDSPNHSPNSSDRGSRPSVKKVED